MTAVTTGQLLAQSLAQPVGAVASPPAATQTPAAANAKKRRRLEGDVIGASVYPQPLHYRIRERPPSDAGHSQLDRSARIVAPEPAPKRLRIRFGRRDGGRQLQPGP